MLAGLDVLRIRSSELNPELAMMTLNIDTFPVFHVDVAWLFILLPIVSIHRSRWLPGMRS